MKKVLIACILIWLLTACTGDQGMTDTPTQDPAGLQGTESAQVTVDPGAGHTVVPTQTLPPVSTWTAVPTIEHTRPAIETPTAEAACDQAAAGHPIDVTIPDGTVMAPGEAFSKTWRLENVGTCTWTTLYALTFFSGNSLNAHQVNYLPAEVEPGEVIDVTVDVEAPMTVGSYQSNWMLSNPNGELFGIGPNGDAPFWVQIEVAYTVTSTPQPTATVTSTPVVYLSGSADLGDGDQFDLDAGELNPTDATQADFVYQNGSDPTHIMMTMNGTVWGVFAETEPTLGDCDDVDLTGNAISFTDVPAGMYLCYQTSDSLPGWMLIVGFEDAKLAVRFLTWAVQ